MKNMSTEEMKSYIKSAGKAHLVKELVESDWPLDAALGWVYDMITLSNTEFLSKHFN